jgi:MarR family transcriptional regulator, temperature-dependent positive regulator of motility
MPTIRLKSPSKQAANATAAPAASARPQLSDIFRQNEIMFGYRIGYLSNYFSGPVYSVVEAEFGMRRPKFATLFCLAHLGTLAARDIGVLSGIPKNSLSRAVNELLREGRIKRAVDDADSRRGLLSLTREGRRIYEQILPMFLKRQAQMMAPLTPAERTQFDRLLAKLVLRDDGFNEMY